MDIFLPPELTQEQKAILEAQRIVAFNKDFLENIIINHKNGFDMVWNNTNATPQEILNVFGTNAYKLFEASFAVQQLITEIKPDYAPLVPPRTYTINQDGTVVVDEIVNGSEE